MSQEQVELVRQSWAAWARGDLDGLFALYDPSAEWNMTHFDGWPEQQLYRGFDEIRGFLDTWRDAWDNYEAGVDELVDTGDLVVALCWQRGMGHATGAVTAMQFAQVCTVRNGKMTRVDCWDDRTQALEAARLQDGVGESR